MAMSVRSHTSIITGRVLLIFIVEIPLVYLNFLNCKEDVMFLKKYFLNKNISKIIQLLSNCQE